MTTLTYDCIKDGMLETSPPIRQFTTFMRIMLVSTALASALIVNGSLPLVLVIRLVSKHKMYIPTLLGYSYQYLRLQHCGIYVIQNTSSMNYKDIKVKFFNLHGHPIMSRCLLLLEMIDGYWFGIYQG